jgi:hypothetical protein
MNETGGKITEQMRQALAAYTGPVTKCRSGNARAPSETVAGRNASVEWLRQNRHVRPVVDQKAVRRETRKARAQQQRIADRNAPLLGRLNKRKRTRARP